MLVSLASTVAPIIAPVARSQRSAPVSLYLTMQYSTPVAHSVISPSSSTCRETTTW